MAIREYFPAVGTEVTRVVRGSGGADLAAPTPCTEFDLRVLVNHFIGTTGALAAVGRGERLNGDDPYGSKADPSQGDWRDLLSHNVDELSRAWTDPKAWTGQVDMGGSEFPAAMVGEMAMAEIVLHGWDLARATGQQLRVPDGLADELRDSVERTGELGRRMGAYGPVIEVGADAGPLDRALAASGRDPEWSGATAGTITGA